jgi:membrane associated rhomboid family serine protease
MGVFTIALLVMFGTLVAIVYVTSGTLAAIIVGAVLVVPWLGLMLVASGAISAFSSTYWTLGYTRLDLEPVPQVAALPPAAAA